jgi:hypothetical protein
MKIIYTPVRTYLEWVMINNPGEINKENLLAIIISDISTRTIHVCNAKISTDGKKIIRPHNVVIGNIDFIKSFISDFNATFKPLRSSWTIIENNTLNFIIEEDAT